MGSFQQWLRFFRRRLRPRLWPIYALVGGLIWLATPTPASLIAGVLPVFTGLGLRLWAVGYLVKTEELAVAGPYAYLRHPLYMGTLLIATGWAIMASSPICWALYAIILAGYFGYYMPYKNRIEAARLEEQHGEAYIRYAVAVPTLIPRLHPYRPLSLDRVGTGSWTREVFLENHEIGTSVVALLGTAAIAARWTLICS